MKFPDEIYAREGHTWHIQDLGGDWKKYINADLVPISCGGTMVRKDCFDLADEAIASAYPDCNNLGKGWWGAQRIPNYGILKGAIERTIRENRRCGETMEKVVHRFVHPYGSHDVTCECGAADSSKCSGTVACPLE